jgi:hypothetical protein
MLAKQSNTTLMTTARVILDLAATSPLRPRCCVHRTTLYYRVDRILELTALPGGTGRAYRQLALWLEAFRSRRSQLRVRQFQAER